MMTKKINTLSKLKIHMKILKKQFKDQGVGEFEMYPLFCKYYQKNKVLYAVPQEQILETACEIFIEEE